MASWKTEVRIARTLETALALICVAIPQILVRGVLGFDTLNGALVAAAFGLVMQVGLILLIQRGTPND